MHAGLLIPAGYDLSWTIHYTPNGTELTDRPEVGLTISETQPERVLIESVGGTDPTKFAIPPNDGNYGPTPAEVTPPPTAEGAQAESWLNVLAPPCAAPASAGIAGRARIECVEETGLS